LAGALAAAKMHIPVVHVEAGLRSFNMKMPEEINRILTDQVSEILFCPTKTAVNNLKNEGFDKRPSKIFNIGDVMYDAAKYYAIKNIRPEQLAASKKPFLLVTIHRAENTDNIDKLTEIISALNLLSEKVDVVCPLHPRTLSAIKNNNLEVHGTLLEPVSYFEMLWLIQNCELVVTDSGGLQKEAYFFKKRCITLRDQTEWLETIESGWNKLVDANIDSIVSSIENYDEPKKWPTLYGDGFAAEKLIKVLMDEG